MANYDKWKLKISPRYAMCWIAKGSSGMKWLYGCICNAINVRHEPWNMHNNPFHSFAPPSSSHPLIAQQLFHGGNHYFLLLYFTTFPFYFHFFEQIASHTKQNYSLIHFHFILFRPRFALKGRDIQSGKITSLAHHFWFINELWFCIFKASRSLKPTWKCFLIGRGWRNMSRVQITSIRYLKTIWTLRCHQKFQELTEKVRCLL